MFLRWWIQVFSLTIVNCEIKKNILNLLLKSHLNWGKETSNTHAGTSWQTGLCSQPVPTSAFKINCHICLTVKNENLIALELLQLTTDEHGGPKNSEKQYGKPLLQLLTWCNQYKIICLSRVKWLVCLWGA